MHTLEEFNQHAIQAALKQDWITAIEYNLKIIDLESNNLSALNRLGKAYIETDQLKLAKKTFNKVIDLDKHNSVALNSLNRIKHGFSSSTPISSFSFIEEPGRTKTVLLYKLATHAVLAKLSSSQKVIFKANKRSICVQTESKKFIGYLPDDLAIHLIQLIKMGNKYEVAIKTVTKDKVEIFIRETKRGARLKGVASFSTKDTNRYYQFLPTDPIAEVPLEIDSDESEER